jgi:hypothetical protein
MNPPAEYDCIDCKSHVFDFGRAEPPVPPRCSVCAWAHEFIADPAEREALRRRLDGERAP